MAHNTTSKPGNHLYKQLTSIPSNLSIRTKELLGTLLQFYVSFNFGLLNCIQVFGKILSSTVNIFAYELKVYSFLECNKVYNCK